MNTKQNKPPISSGWRGDINGHVEETETTISVSKIKLEIDKDTAWALCNMLFESTIDKTLGLEKNQKIKLKNLGAALGRLIDHSAANNGGRNIIRN